MADIDFSSAYQGVAVVNVSGSATISFGNAFQGVAVPDKAAFVAFPRPRGLDGGASVMAGGLSQ